MPEIVIVAGPNGAGKSTFAREFLTGCRAGWPYVNADDIASEMNPADRDAVALAAGREMLRRLDALVAARADFAFETTLSGGGYLKRIREWRDAGYSIEMHYLRLNSARLAQRRVSLRVSQGGHNIPLDVISRRFEASEMNLGPYTLAVERTLVYNSSAKRPKLIHAVRVKQEATAMSKRIWVEVDEREDWVAEGMDAMRRAGEKAVERARALGLEPVVEEPVAGLPFDPEELFGDALEKLPAESLPRAAE